MDDGLHNTVLDSHDESLLLFGTGTNTDCSKELPDVNILSGIDSTREDVGESRFEGIEESIVNANPVQESVNNPR